MFLIVFYRALNNINASPHAWFESITHIEENQKLNSLLSFSMIMTVKHFPGQRRFRRPAFINHKGRDQTRIQHQRSAALLSN